ncbi:hypothetical protein ACC808_37320, partial [Rhizobium ruizarguesonis]
AIIEYVAELYPYAGLLPRDRAERALACSVSREVLSSFRALRTPCPMNIRRPKGKIALRTNERLFQRKRLFAVCIGMVLPPR